MRHALLALALPVLASAQAGSPAPDPALQEMLDGRGPCRASEVKALVATLDGLQGLESADEARAAVKGVFGAYCGKKAGALYYRWRGAYDADVRESGSAVWIERGGLTLKNNAELEDFLVEQAVADHERGVLDPRGTPTMTRRFRLLSQVIGTSLAWCRPSDPSAPATVRVNAGDTVVLALARGASSPEAYPNLTLPAYRLAVGAGETRFVADRAGVFEFFDANWPSRLAGTLIVYPR